MGCGNCFGQRKQVDQTSNCPIKPPKSRKKVLFDETKYSKIDKHASKVALRHLKNFAKLVSHLRKPVDESDELGLLRALFVWTTRLNLNNVLAKGIPDGTEPKPDSPLDFLSKLKINLINHAHLFQILCRYVDDTKRTIDHANIPCEIINGINKNASYKIGYHLNQDNLKAQWNAVHVCGEWRFIDSHWGSSGVLGSKSTDWVMVNLELEEHVDDASENSNSPESQVINDFFFLTDPDMFICTHMPFDPKWQLLPQPVSVSRFESSVYVREKFFLLDLSVSDITKTHCVLQTVDGLLEVGFGIPEAKATSAAFKFLLYNYKEEFKFDHGFTLEHYVLSQLSVDSVSFTLRFPKSGTFRFDIFGRECPTDPYDLVCSYVIQCKKPKKRCLPLPFIPVAGWGPTIACHQMNIIPSSHNSAVITSPDGLCDIQFGVHNMTWMKYQVLATGVEDWLLNTSVLAWREGHRMFMRTRFRQEGEYALKVIASNLTTLGKPENVCNYLIVVQSSSNLHEFPLLRGCMLGPTDQADQFQVKPVSHDSVIIRTHNSNLSLTMSMADDVEMLAEITNNEIDSRFIYTHVSREQYQGKATFTIHLPSKEEFGVNLYIRKQGETQAVYHTYTYYVVVEPMSQSTSSKSIQDDTASQGKTSLVSRKSSMASGHNSQPSIESTLPEIVIPVAVSTAKKKVTAKVVTRLKPMLCELQPDETTQLTFKKLNLSCKSKDSDTLFTVGLPHLGKYTLNVFEEISPGLISMFASYNIHRRDHVAKEIGVVPLAMSAEEKKHFLLSMRQEEQSGSLKRALKVGLRTKNTPLLQQTLKQMEELEMKDDEEGLMKQAKEMLLWLSIRDALTKAMSKRDEKRIGYLLDSIINNDMVNKFAVEVAAAKRLLEYLRRLDRLKRLRKHRTEVMNLEAPTMAEIRSYPNPPVPVHLVLMATCVLLGEDSDQLQDWGSVKKIISQPGKMSLQHRVYNYDLENLTIEMAKEAQCILNSLELETVLAVSPAAATFYVWAIGTIEEAEIKYAKEGIAYTKPASKNHQNIFNIVNDYFATKRGSHAGWKHRDEFENIDATFAQPHPKDGAPRKQSVIQAQNVSQSQDSLSVYDSRRQSKSSVNSSSSTQSLILQRMDQVKAVWESIEDDRDETSAQ